MVTYLQGCYFYGEINLHVTCRNNNLNVRYNVIRVKIELGCGRYHLSNQPEAEILVGGLTKLYSAVLLHRIVWTSCLT